MKCLVALLAVLSSSVRAETLPSNRSLPWLVNFSDVSLTTADDRASSLPLDILADVDPSCAGVAYGALALHVDGFPGVSTVVASYAHGVIVTNAEGKTVATAPGYPCFGTADELEVVAVGRSWGTPMIALVLTTGGRRETMTWVGFYRPGRHGQLEATFSGAVEKYEDGVVRRGRITLLPGALIHQDPSGVTVLWVFHQVPGVFMPYSLGSDPHMVRR